MSITKYCNMNTYQRTFIFSSEIFSSYEVLTDIRYLDSIDEIIDFCKRDLIQTLRKHNLVNLIDKCENTQFHIHTHTLPEILLLDPEACIYLCSCEKK